MLSIKGFRLQSANVGGEEEEVDVDEEEDRSEEQLGCSVAGAEEGEQLRLRASQGKAAVLVWAKCESCFR